jgi:hypothetical protein
MNDNYYKRQQRRENIMLKKKIATLQGDMSVAKDLPLEVQNNFMRSVLEFEEQVARKKKIRVIDKVGTSLNFKKSTEISDADIEQEWLELYEQMCNNGIGLQVCSPNVTARELYRFTTEELFLLKVDDISVPGMMTCFVYDEFYPDYKYENSQTAVDNCIMCFLGKKDMYDYYFTNTVKFNHHSRLRKNDLLEWWKFFKSGFSATKDVQVEIRDCILEGHECIVNGLYKATFIMAENERQKSGNWAVSFSFDKKLRCWKINNVQIENIEN